MFEIDYVCTYIYFQSPKVNGLGFIFGYCLRATKMRKFLASVDVTVAIGGNFTLLLYSSGDMILAVTYMKQLLLLFEGDTKIRP